MNSVNSSTRRHKTNCLGRWWLRGSLSRGVGYDQLTVCHYGWAGPALSWQVLRDHTKDDDLNTTHDAHDSLSVKTPNSCDTSTQPIYSCHYIIAQSRKPLKVPGGGGQVPLSSEYQVGQRCKLSSRIWTFSTFFLVTQTAAVKYSLIQVKTRPNNRYNVFIHYKQKYVIQIELMLQFLSALWFSNRPL